MRAASHAMSENRDHRRSSQRSAVNPGFDSANHALKYTRESIRESIEATGST
jgi:hypothetical protein